MWIDQAYFRWHANFYIVLVAPPGIVSKSTTASVGMSLLRKVPGIKFGPDVVTWPALLQGFEEATEMFEYGGEYLTMSAMTLESSEFGNLLNPQDKEMVDLLVSLWDGKEGGFEKKTKHSGSDSVANPWINLIACTTPAWIAGNFPEYMIGGGFTSRCVFVYADEKAHYVAYPYRHVPENMEDTKAKLIHDLEWISQNLCGAYQLTEDAIAWGEEWYKHHYTHKPVHLDDDRFGGYLARKQTHIHKLAMIMAASRSDDLTITAEILRDANSMVTDLEPDMAFVFSKIGKSDVSFYADRMVQHVHKCGQLEYMDLYRFMHSHFPNLKEFEDVMSGCIRAGYMTLTQEGSSMVIKAGAPLAKASNGRRG